MRARWLLPLLPCLLVLAGVGPCDPPCADGDGDGVCDAVDVCPGADDLADADQDGAPDACDECPDDPGEDADGDGVCDALDPCPLDAPDDADGNGVCDVVDAYPFDDELRLNHVQVKGTHNSYHVEPPLPFDSSHEYTHVPLDEQLEVQGVRAFEIDVHRDADQLAVYHIIGIDSQTTCRAFRTCLETIEAWSDAHRHHLPILIWIEPKDDAGGAPLDLAEVDAALRAVFPGPRLFTPADLQGAAPTLQAALAGGWPTLGELRGKVMVMLLDTGAHRDAYTAGGSSYVGRPMFVEARDDELGAPYATVAKINDPAASTPIAAAHAHHVLVASNLCGAGDGDPECVGQLAAALANGVHMMKDDFPGPVAGRSYFLDVPDGNPARCNDVTAPPVCTSEALEDL